MEERKKIALVLPAHNLGGFVEKSLEKVGDITKHFAKKFKFLIYIVDDGSEDNTYLKIKKWASGCSLQVFLIKNKENIGLVRSLKKTYEKILEESSWPDYVLKTDLDKDYDQKEAIEELLNCVPENNFSIWVGYRGYNKDELEKMIKADNGEYCRRKI